MEVTCFLPGILGSELRTQDGRTVWPPKASEVVSGLAPWKIEALLSEEDLVSKGAVERVCVKNVYRGLLRTIEDAGFSRTGQQKRLEVLHYDWRLDIVDEIAPKIAARLDDLVEAGATDFHLVAHSMGGLVARVLLQHELYADRPWRPQIRQLITIATPYRGAPQALSRLLGLEGTLGIPADAFAELRKKPRLRAPCQLLPPDGIPLIWKIECSRIIAVPFFGQEGFALKNGFPPEMLESIGRLHKILDADWPDHVQAFQFAGTGFETVTRLAEHAGMRSVRDDNSGDETVPLSSATATSAPTMILPGDHLSIVNNEKLGRTLRALLGSADLAVIFAADEKESADGKPPTIQISLPPLGTVPMDGVVSVPGVLALSRPLDEEKIAVIIVRPIDTRSEEIGDAPVLEMQVAINSGLSEQRFRLEGELAPGLYDVTVDLPGDIADRNSLAVREPGY